MKSRGLLSVLSYSEKRENLLFLLYNGPKTLTDIKDYFKVSSPEILPRIREMENRNLISRENGKYVLTTTGRVISGHFQSFIKTLRVIERNEEFWKNHAMEAIPLPFLERIGEFGDCKMIRNRLENIFEPHVEFFENISRSKEVRGVAPIFNPSYPSFFLNLAKKNISISLILTRNVFNRICDEYGQILQNFLKYHNTSLYVINDDIKIAFVTTDTFLSLSLFFNNGTFDSNNDLISYDKSALKWGEDIFNYYKILSHEIKGNVLI